MSTLHACYARTPAHIPHRRDMLRGRCIPPSLRYELMYAKPILQTDTKLTPPACRSICKVESDFNSIPLTSFKLKNRHWWNSGKKYHRINFVVKVNLGPADLSFELWHNGVKLSKDNAIKVEWQAAAPPDPQETPVASDFPMNSLPAAANRGVARKSVQNLRNVDPHGYTPGSGFGNGWDSKMGVRTNVVPARQNGSVVW
jgi:hypothetical protein